jgi:hypothetical protein
MNLIGLAERSEYNSAMADIHDTFSRPILVYKTPEQTIISTDTNYNYFYNGPEGNGGEDYVSYTPVSGVVNARIMYDKNLERLFNSPTGEKDQDFGVTADNGMARLKIKKEDWATYFEGVIDVQFDGFQFENYKVQRPHVLFDPTHYTLYLKIKN